MELLVMENSGLTFLSMGEEEILTQPFLALDLLLLLQTQDQKQ